MTISPKVILGGVFLLVFGIAIGLVVAYLYFQSKIDYQGRSAKDWSNLASENMTTTKEYSQKLSDLTAKYASVSAALQALRNAPSPTPVIQYVQQKPNVKCQVVANAYSHFTMCCDANGSCYSQ